MRKLLVFHKAIAPYRIDFFNSIYEKFDAKIVLDYKNLKSQTFDYSVIESALHFKPSYLEYWRKIGKRNFYKGYSKYLSEFKPDIVMTSEYGLNLWVAVIKRFFLQKKYKIITICDDSLKMTEECSEDRKKSRKMALHFLDGVILCNPAAQEWYSHHTDVKTFCFPIIHKDEVFTEKLRSSYAQVEDDIRKYNLVGKKVFLFVGRLSPEKNIEYLVKSFIVASKKHNDIELLIVGDDGSTDGTVRRNIEKMIAEEHCSCIQLLGRKEGTELYSIYSCGQVLILPSLSEAFGAVTNEALLAGEYVMVSKYAGSASLVTSENGEVTDIEESTIDFDNMITRLEPVSEHWNPRDSKMPVSYEKTMSNLVDWISGL